MKGLEVFRGELILEFEGWVEFVRGKRRNFMKDIEFEYLDFIFNYIKVYFL